MHLANSRGYFLLLLVVAAAVAVASGVVIDCGSFAVSGSPDFASCKVPACPGETISASLCYPDSKCEGDTYLTLHSASDANRSSSRVASNDDYCGVCSSLTHVVSPSARCQVYELRQGCFSSFCSGSTAVTVTTREPRTWDPWYYQNALHEKGAVVTVWFIEVALWSFLSLFQLLAHRNAYTSAVHKIGIFKAVLVFSLWFLIEFTILSARFKYYLSGNNGAEYEPYRLGSGELVFLSDEFFAATPEELNHAGCDYQDIIGAHEHSGDYTCSFIYPLGPQLISQGYVQFSVGVQLIFIVFLQYTCLLTKIFLLDQHSSGTVASNALISMTCASVEFMLNLHQFMILLPLTAVLPNLFCAVVQVPVSTEKAICLFKIAAAMFPYGIPSVLGGALLMYIAYSFGKSGGKTNNAFLYLLSCIVGVGGVYFLVTGLCLVIFWIFGCIILGMWYGLEGVSLSYQTSETAIIMNMMKCSPYMFSFFDVVLFPLPLNDENSFYHGSYVQYQRFKDFTCNIYSSEPFCVDTCTWLWVSKSTFELWVSEKVGSCCENISLWCFYCCHKPGQVQIACEDIVITDTS